MCVYMCVHMHKCAWKRVQMEGTVSVKSPRWDIHHPSWMDHHIDPSINIIYSLYPPRGCNHCPLIHNPPMEQGEDVTAQMCGHVLEVSAQL